MSKALDTIESALTSDTDECIEWPYSRGKNGYGIVWDGVRTVTANRMIAMKTHGVPPTRKHQAAHSCGNRGCINPRHLRWATAKENAADRLIHGTHQERDACSHTKIPEVAIRVIRRGDQETDKFYATFYGASVRTVQSIRYGWNRKGAIETHMTTKQPSVVQQPAETK